MRSKVIGGHMSLLHLLRSGTKGTSKSTVRSTAIVIGLGGSRNGFQGFRSRIKMESPHATIHTKHLSEGIENNFPCVYYCTTSHLPHFLLSFLN